MASNSPQSQQRFFCLGVLIMVASVIAFYAWIAGQSPTYGDLTRDYTQRLAGGHADLSIKPDPRLLALPDPYDPRANAGISALDTSLYGGHYYVYFGITPFITLLVPWFLLTGHHLAEPLAVMLYASGGFLLASATILAARRRYFPGTGRFATIAALLVLGVASPVELAVRRPMIYELVIAGAWFHLALALFCAFRALHAERGRGCWLLAAAVSMGLAVGSRATYAPASVFFLAWVGALTTRRFSTVFTRRQWLWAGLLPLAVIGGGVAAFNWSRFGNPLEFGFSYQINELDRSKVVVWAWRNFPFNLRQYFLRPWRLGGYFPFFLGERAGPISALKDYGRTEFLYGSLATTPVLALLAAAPWALRRMGRLGALAVLAAGISLLNLVALLGLINGSFRYQIDVVPGLLVVLGWTLLAIFGSPLLAGPRRTWARAATAVLVAGSCLVMFFAQFALLDVFRTFQPQEFAQLGRRFNGPVFRAGALLHRQPEVPVVTLRLPTDKFGKVEPLLVTGEYTLQDFLYAYYAGPGLLQVGFESMGHGGPVSAPIALDYSQPHQLEIFYGSMVPPAGHPLLDNLAPGEIAELRRTVVVKVDGRPVLDGWAEFHDTKGLFYWGESPDDQAFGRRFTGAILARGAVPLSTEPSPERNQRTAYGALQLDVNLAAVPVGARVPLLAAGYSNHGAVVFLERPTRDSARVGLSENGRAAALGPVVPLDPSRPHEVRIVLGSLLPPLESLLWPEALTPDRRQELKRSVRVGLDGHSVLLLTQETPEAAPSTVEVGRNSVGFSGIAPGFGDGIALRQREPVGETIAELNRAPAP